MRIAQILKDNQETVYYKLCSTKKRKHRKRRRGKHLSLSYVDKLMKERADVDERKCQGR